MLDELDSLALITLVHVRIFGHKIGSLLVGDSLRDQRDAEFGRGAAAGAADLLRWLDDRSCTPLSLTDYLLEEGAPSTPDKSATIIRLPTRLHMKTAKRIKRDEQ